MAEIALRNGGMALVDDADLPALAAKKWALFSTDGRNYARGAHGVLMHRVVLGAAHGAEVDHINGNGLDNRRANLRVVTHTQNLMNNRRPKSSTGFKGVWMDRRRKARPFRAQIGLDGIRVHLGFFDSAQKAADAYDAAALKHFGEYAATNKEIVVERAGQSQRRLAEPAVEWVQRSPEPAMAKRAAHRGPRSTDATAPGGSRQKGGSVKDEHILRPLARIEGKLTLALRALGVLLREGEHMAGELDILKAEVEENATVVGSAVTLLQNLKTLLDAAIASGDMTQVAALSQQLSDQTDALAAAVVANTLAA